MIGLLVALVIFWGLFPPAWFFTEYLLFDRDTILLPVDVLDKIKAAPAASQAEVAASFKPPTSRHQDLRRHGLEVLGRGRRGAGHRDRTLEAVRLNRHSLGAALGRHRRM